MLQLNGIHVTRSKEVNTMRILLGIIEKAYEVLTALIGLGITILTFISVIKVITHSIKK